MNLERLAEGIIDYLDSVDVAAEYQIHHKFLTIITDNRNFIMAPSQCFHEFINEIESYYPKRKSPN